MEKKPSPKFFSCSVHLIDQPWSVLKIDPVQLHNQDEAIQKMHRFCHEIYRVPITWLCSWPALHKYRHYLVDFVKNHGDEVAIMDGTIYSAELLGGEVEKYQSWVEECGLKRPGADFQSKEAEVRQGSRSLQDMSYDEQKIALTYLKKRYDEILGQNTRTLASPWNNGDTIKVMKEVGLDVAQGYCWNYFCEGINHKGAPLQSFYAGEINQNVPDRAIEGPKVLGIQWGPLSPVIGTSVEAHARMGFPGYCMTAIELANRSEGHDKFRYQENMVREWVEQATWNDYSFTPLQLEAVWMDESEMPPESYDQFPGFNSMDTEVFYSEIETALRSGATALTLSGFADWHREHANEKAAYIYYSEDHLPDLQSKGKDQPYQPMIVYADQDKQFWFLKGRGGNYIRRYLYDPAIPNSQIEEEYPFDLEPKVYLKAKSGLNIQAGISIDQNGAIYQVDGFTFSAYHEDPNYAFALWNANLPSYVTDRDIETGGEITGFRTLREKNIALVFADLKRGENELIFRSTKPSEHIRIKSIGRVGQRYEVWIENDAEAAQLHTIRVKLEPGLKIGGFWWDGFYSRSIFRYGWGGYDRETGELDIRCFYPVTLKINQGLTRFSIELR